MKENELMIGDWCTYIMRLRIEQANAKKKRDMRQIIEQQNYLKI